MHAYIDNIKSIHIYTVYKTVLIDKQMWNQALTLGVVEKIRFQNGSWLSDV